MLKELSEDLNSIKKIQSEMKDPLIDIKSNLSQTQSPSITWLCFKNSICWYDRFCTISTLTKFNHVHSSSHPFKSSRFVYTGGGKSRFISVYAKHRVYSGVIINYCIIFHMNNHTPTFAPSCICWYGNRHCQTHYFPGPHLSESLESSYLGMVIIPPGG